MRRETTSGFLLIACALAFAFVMTFHPTSHGPPHGPTHGNGGGMHLGVLVHALAIVTAPIAFLGLLGAARRLAPSDAAVAALVAFGFGVVAVLGAALASGFVHPDVLARVAPIEGPKVAHALLLYTSVWNQAFAKVHIVAWSLAILLLSVAMLRRRDAFRFAIATALGGIAVCVFVLALFLSEAVVLDVPGARTLWLPQAAWMLWIGILLCFGQRDPLRSIARSSSSRA